MRTLALMADYKVDVTVEHARIVLSIYRSLDLASGALNFVKVRSVPFHVISNTGVSHYHSTGQGSPPPPFFGYCATHGRAGRALKGQGSNYTSSPMKIKQM
jgi:hypothetical protein